MHLQVILRGGGLQEVGAELRSKLFDVWRASLIFWLFAHAIVFSIPVWWLQPMVDNLFTFGFNVYLALAAHRPPRQNQLRTDTLH